MDGRGQMATLGDTSVRQARVYGCAIVALHFMASLFALDWFRQHSNVQLAFMC